jgi:acyl phosphate:glycerol-3-phosphate acyltransferase
MEYIYITLFSYISGSIPFGLILTKIFNNQDIRKIGSGNIGATNVYRSGNKILAIATLFLDMAKGYFPVYLVYNFNPEYVHHAALLAFLGHLFPVWLKFKGGKGVATYLGILFALSIALSILFIFTWVTVILIFNYSSVSSIFSSLTVFVVTIYREVFHVLHYGKFAQEIAPNYLLVSNLKWLLFIFLILIIFSHKKNIYNLKNGTEKKIKI